MLHTCLSLGFDLSYFCWHPAMHSVGACRQCAIKEFKDENDTKGRIVMSCMTDVKDGMRISIDDPDARKFRASIIEWLMVNHPHDCPVCDEGGECHLQDMTVMTGHVYRRFRFKKRTHENQDLGPLVAHDMNRCIQCYRCVRFYRDYAGGRDFQVFACRNAVYFGRYESGTLESEFAGNLVEVCPTGVFTDKTLAEHFTRKWDLQTAPSICVHCGVGCNTIPGERYGFLRRIRNRYHHEVNGYFLCDRGRYGYMFVNGEARIKQPRVHVEGGTEHRQIDREKAFASIRDMVGRSDGRVLGIGSARASLESNFALRSLVGPENFFAGLAPRQMDLLRASVRFLSGPARSPSLADAAQADAVFVIGENVPDTAPIMALTLRQAARNGPMKALPQLKIQPWNANAINVAIEGQKGPFYVISTSTTRLDDLAELSLQLPPDYQARLGFAVANLISPRAPAVPGLQSEMKQAAERIATGLKQADHPLIVSGIGSGSQSILEAAANVAWALCETGKRCLLSYVLPECNSMGLVLLEAQNLDRLLNHRPERDLVLIVLENDLYQHLERPSVEKLLSSNRVILLDHLQTETARLADIVLPAATFAEADGTLVNFEGRAQRFYQVFIPDGAVRQSWEWIGEIMNECGQSPGWGNLDELQRDMADALPVFSKAPEAAPPAGYRVAGMRVARQPHRYSGRTAMFADTTVFEPRPAEDVNTPFSFSMEGYTGQPSAALIPRFWAPGWNSVQSVNKFQEEVAGTLRGGDPGRRLITPSERAEIPFGNRIPVSFEPKGDDLLILARAAVFGSDEQSRYSPPIQKEIFPVSVWVNGDDAVRLGAKEGQEMILSINDFQIVLPLRIDASLPPRLAMVPSWLPGLPGGNLPLWGRLRMSGRHL